MSNLGRICPEVLKMKFKKFVIAFLLFCNYLPFEKGLDLHIKNWIDTLCQVCLKMPHWFWRRRLLCIFTICNYLHFEKGVSLIWKKKLEASSPKDTLCQVWYNWPVVLEKKMNMWKVNTQTGRQTGRRRTTDDHKKHTWAFSSGELKFISWNFIDYFIG